MFDTVNTFLPDRMMPSPSRGVLTSSQSIEKLCVMTLSVAGSLRLPYLRLLFVENRDGFRDAPRDRFL
jgi:hypothetical protein